MFRSLNIRNIISIGISALTPVALIQVNRENTGSGVCETQAIALGVGRQNASG